jgi:hypothetical protein
VTDYITLSEFKDRVGQQTSVKDSRIAEHITAASRKVDAICHRTFGPHDGAATARDFRPLDCEMVFVDDCYDISAVGVDDADTGLYATAWSAASYDTDPPNGIGPNGQEGWPITTLRSIGALYFPTCLRRRAVRVTAKWGWEAIPADVKEATYLLANRLLYEVAVPGGVTPPNVDFGMSGSALQRPYTAEGLLKPYQRQDRVIGVAG